MKLDTSLLASDLRETPRQAAHAERLGFDGLWTAEAGHDPYLPAVAAATATERITIGTNIAVAFPRSPLVHAQIAWDLQQASRGRFILGLGTQVKGHNERRYSVKWDAPAPRLREMIQLIRHIWDVWQTGVRPSFQGKYYQFSLMTPFFAPAPIDWPKIPIYIAAVNPYILRVAGEVADGVHVHPFHSVRYVNEVVLPNVAAGVDKAKRQKSDVTLATTAFVIAGNTREEIARAKSAVRQQISFYASTRTYSTVLETHGWGETSNRLNERAAKGDWGGMAELITDEMLEVYAVEGTWKEIPVLLRKKYEGLIERVGFYVPVHPGADDDRWRDLLAACR